MNKIFFCCWRACIFLIVFCSIANNFTSFNSFGASKAWAAPTNEKSIVPDDTSGNTPSDAPADIFGAYNNGVQAHYLEVINNNTNVLHEDALKINQKLQSVVPVYDKELMNLFALKDTYEKTPRVLEAVGIKIQKVKDKLNVDLEPAKNLKVQAEDLLLRLTQLEKNFPVGLGQTNTSSKDPNEHLKTIKQIKVTLNNDIKQLNNTIALSESLIEKINPALAQIESTLPSLWEAQYFSPPLHQTYIELWGDMGFKLKGMWQDLDLRVHMEIPGSNNSWKQVGSRFFGVLFFGLLFSGILISRWLKRNPKGQRSKGVSISRFYPCIPWLTGGLALVGASLSSYQPYQALLVLGNLLLVIGQFSLAWALRCKKFENLPVFSPLWPLCITALLGYTLLYPALPVSFLAAIWMVILILALVWCRSHRKPLALQLENGILQSNTVVLWVCLFLHVIGLPYISILLYILFTSLAVGLQLSIGAMQALHSAADKLPKEGIKAVLGSIWLACAAPAMIVLVCVGVVLWTITLPGGYPLLNKYVLTGFNVGDTRFNILQVLFIISAFYIARASVSVGKSLLHKMPERGIKVDSSLIPPMQTGFTYGVWVLFALFSLKTLGMELSNLAVVAGGLSVGIGFGMQAIVNNFLSGLILIFSRILQEGDVVEVGGLTGTVRKISVRATTVETKDSAVIYVPNSEFVSRHLINWTRNGRSVRREITVGVAYGSDTDKVISLLREAAQSNDNVLKYPEPSVVFASFGANTLDFILRFWVHDFNVAQSVASVLRQDIEKLFRQNNVEVAFPQLDVHIKELPKTLSFTPRKGARVLGRGFNELLSSAPLAPSASSGALLGSESCSACASKSENASSSSVLSPAWARPPRRLRARRSNRLNVG